MKTRIISAVVAIALASVVLYFHTTPVFVIAIALISALIEFELVRAMKGLEHKFLAYSAVIYNFCVPFLVAYVSKYLIVFNAVAAICALLIFVSNHLKLSHNLFFSVVATAVLVSASLSCMVKLNDKYSLWYVIIALCCAWVADTFAYFVGSAIGKHKLSPVISPKKSVEGFIGGILADGIILELVYIFLMNKKGSVMQYVLFAVIALICGALGTLGDLSASVIKRQEKIKDYGNIMPGHGGALDRFDSVLVVAPTFYVLINLFNL